MPLISGRGRLQRRRRCRQSPPHQRNPRHTSTMLKAVFFVAFVGVASPFALGSTSDMPSISSTTDVIRRQELQRQPSSHKLHLQRQRPAPPMTLTSTVAPEETKISKRTSLRKFVSQFNPSGGKKDGRWKGGESTATLASRLSFSYVNPLLDLAKERNLDEKDAFELDESLKMKRSVDCLSSTYDEVRAKSKRRIEEQKQRSVKPEKIKSSQSMMLLKALAKRQRSALIITGLLRLINTAIQAFPAILLSRLLKIIETGESVPLSQAITTAMTLVSLLCVKMIVENQFFHRVVTMATQTRGSLEGLIFDKSLRLPGGGSGVLSKRKKDDKKKALGSGGVLNLMQSDASTLESTTMQVHTTWDGLLQIFMYTALLFRYLGPSVYWGLGVLLTVIPLNACTLRILDRLAQAELDAKDARSKRTSESITNMKLLKLQGWEGHFGGDVRKHRRDEMNRHKMRGIVRALNSAITNAVPSLVLVSTLTAYAKSGRPIVASTIFAAISLFNQLRFPLFFYPMLIDSIVNGKHALRRISSYLESEELVQYVQKLPPHENGGGSISMKNGNFLWSTSEPPKDGEVAPPAAPALCGANLEVQPGEIVAVVGPVASGKSAIIKSLLGELSPVPRLVVDKNGDMGSKPQSSEINLDTPLVSMRGTVSYCSQEAWLPKGPIRDAVVFGREYDEERYMRAIYDAGLDRDIMDNANGDSSKAAASSGTLSHDTDVGEGGSSLSGGQRARVALARSLYGDAQVYLIDDCLAALDVNVGSLVFDRVTKRLRAANAAVVWVTNDRNIPRRCDRVVLMGSMGKKPNETSSCSTIVGVGTYYELLAKGHSLESIASEVDEDDDEMDKLQQESIVSYVNGSHKSADRNGFSPPPETIRSAGGYKVPANGTDTSCVGPDCHEVDMQQTSTEYFSSHTAPPLSEEDLEHAFEKAPVSTTTAKKPETLARKLTSTDDKMTSEAVPLSTYFSYFKAVDSPLLIAAMFVAYGTSTGAQFFQQYTVAKWTELSHASSVASALGGKYLQQLVWAAGVVSVFLWLRSFFTMLVGLRASKFYHNRMVRSVFRAPMSFFDSTPSGQILSRFGSELGTIDRALPDSYASVIFCALQIGSSALSLAGAITPAMMLPLLIVGSQYSKVIARFRPAARDLKRTDTKTRAPIYTLFGEALRGTEVIRSIPSASRIWSDRHRSLTDTNLAAYSTVKALDRWLSISLEALGNFMVFVSALASVFLSRAGRLKGGSAGWGLTQSMAITGLMAWAVRNLTSLETQMMSVMRVRELTDLDAEEAVLPKGEDAKAAVSLMPRELSRPGEALERELPVGSKSSVTLAPVNETALIESGWPWKGDIQFGNIAMRYNEASPLVLDGVTISVPPGTTLGVVGRTGSGKSSLLLTLFRIVEIESGRGTGSGITIDGVDIRSVGIQTLRERLSIIPQEPVLFAGTVASNLDATGRSSEADMWEALETASPELAAFYRSSGEGLHTAISEGGSNLSLGQRALICLARALLRKSQILCLDEATASVDTKTDQQVQDTIRRQFVEKGVTTLTVAHRLDTIIDYDKVLVLGNGKVLECDTPARLLRRRNGAFAQMVDETGPVTSRILRNRAQAKERRGSQKASPTVTSTRVDRGASEPAKAGATQPVPVPQNREQ